MGSAAGEAWGAACGAAAALAALAARAPSLAEHAAAVQAVNQHLASLPLAQVTVAVCRHLAAEDTPSAAANGSSEAAADAVDAPPSGHVQHSDVQAAAAQVDGLLQRLGLQPVATPAALEPP